MDDRSGLDGAGDGMLSDAERERYQRQLALPEFGTQGQARLRGFRVLVVGTGALGAPLLLYLAAAGIGRIGIVDHGTIALSDLSRQIIHDGTGIGGAKTEGAAARLHALNPEVRTTLHSHLLTVETAPEILSGYDLVADCSGNFPTRFLLNDFCHVLGKPLVTGAAYRFDGQLATFKSHLGAQHPCYRCLFPETPPPGLVPGPDAGVLGAAAGLIGTLQAVEIVKELLGIGQSLSGRQLIYDGLRTVFHTLPVVRNPGCPLCGPTPKRGRLARDYPM